ncbi:MAG: hypothetical protein FJW27_10480 [Acidimicrobiia bacterium]|nr:hypothetical protein [Acidimicrobiia bacterium]
MNTSAQPGAAGVVGAAAIVLLLIASAAGVQAYREVRYPSPPATAGSLYLTSGTAIRRLTLGYHALAADLYWVRAIQYYGSTKLRLAGQQGRPAPAGGADAQQGYPLLYPMLDLTTTLDPRFNIAYRFGAIFLAEPFPGGAGQPDLAIALLEKGLRHRPDKWEYMQDIGFVHYWWRHDYTAAAEWFKRGSAVPGAPWWLKSLAATTLSEGGDRRSSRLMWESIRESAEIEWLKSDAERRLTQLRALDQIDEIQAYLKQATERGFAVADWNAVVRAGVLPGIPLDPAQVPYELDAEGRVQLSPRSPLFPLPIEPKRLKPMS